MERMATPKKISWGETSVPKNMNEAPISSSSSQQQDPANTGISASSSSPSSSSRRRAHGERESGDDSNNNSSNNNHSSSGLMRRFYPASAAAENLSSSTGLSYSLSGLISGWGPDTPTTSSRKTFTPGDHDDDDDEPELLQDDDICGGDELLASSRISSSGNQQHSHRPLSLEGTVAFRKCHTSDNLKQWRQGYVVFDMRNGGSISCYKHGPPEEKKDHTHLIHSSNSNSSSSIRQMGISDTKNQNYSFVKERAARLSYKVAEYDHGIVPRIHLPAHVKWVAKDIQNNASGFIIEIPSDDPLLPSSPNPTFPEEEIYLNKASQKQGPLASRGSTDCFPSSPVGSPASFPEMISPFGSYDDDAEADDNDNDDDADRKLPDDLKADIDRAKTRGQSFRIYFRCSRRGNEKVLWLRAFEQMDRLAYDFYRQPGIRNILGSTSLQISTSRTRSNMARLFANEGNMLESSMLEDEGILSVSKHGGETMHQSMRVRNDGKEYLVYPHYAYPNRWMTDSELYAEMIKPSDIFHDLRRPDAPKKEIGFLKVELLQCVGLPALDFASETDAVAYMVCGSYAFTSDVIWNKLNPMWLPRSRRACVFPLFHAYARLYLGIFDDDGKGEKDDFAGRVVLNLAQCRPRSTYDVTLPLRLSRDVYSKRPRGSVRLRFYIEYHSERDALLSYIPRKMRSQTSVRPDDDVTVICADEKAFRNIVTTVHGIHMPGRFSFAEWRAVMREANFARKVATNTVLDLIIGIVKWENPALSLLIFCAWMHCIYKNAFSLVPCYLLLFLLLMMVRTYAFYGSDGPIQNGYIPPSWEEMFMALVKGGAVSRIEPLKTSTPRAPSKGLQSSRRLQHVVGEFKTHRQRGNWIFRLFSFKKELGPDHDPRDYHMEFPFSRGIHNPMTKETQYPKFTVAESLVSKSSIIGKNKKKEGDEDGDNMMEDGLEMSAISMKSPRRRTFDLFSPRSSSADKPATVAERRRSFASPKSKSRTNPNKSQKVDTPVSSFRAGNSTWDDLPPRLRLPEQNADTKGPAKKKKLGDELAELRDNLHKLSFHLFNDRTHRIREGTCYFGTAQRGRTAQTENELERLLNVGQYSSGNPVVARVGLYVEPIISAAHSALSLSRVVYNIFTWRDPFLSFWVSLALLAATFILAIFPWRLFLFVTGCLVVGPQNYVLRVMEERGTTPKFIRDFVEKRKNKAKVAQDKKKSQSHIPKTLPQNQPIISSHSSDNMPPSNLSYGDIDPREVQEVCIPYSQLMYHRMYDWPPEPGYAKCYPTAELEQQIVQRTRNRSASRDTLLSLGSQHTRSSSTVGDFSVN